MILGTIIDVILAFIPKKLLLVILVALIAALYVGFDFNF